MRVRVIYSVDVTDDFRRALRSYYGETGMATRDEVYLHCCQYGSSIDADIMEEYRKKQLYGLEDDSE
jgi:hypothetical protein